MQAKHSGCCLVVGGKKWRDMLDTVDTEGQSVVIATVGRLYDVVHRGEMRLEGVTKVLLDEADELLPSTQVAAIWYPTPAVASCLQRCSVIWRLRRLVLLRVVQPLIHEIVCLWQNSVVVPLHQVIPQPPKDSVGNYLRSHLAQCAAVCQPV